MASSGFHPAGAAAATLDNGPAEQQRPSIGELADQSFIANRRELIEDTGCVISDHRNSYRRPYWYQY